MTPFLGGLLRPRLSLDRYAVETDKPPKTSSLLRPIQRPLLRASSPNTGPARPGRSTPIAFM